MKSAWEIQLDYNHAVRQAESLNQIAGELRSTANQDMQDSIGAITQSWTGSNSNAYISKYNTLKDNVVVTAGKLDEIADTLRRIARNTYDAEMAALRLAMERKY